MMTKATRLLAVLATVLAGSVATGKNLIPNPDFHRDPNGRISGFRNWTDYVPTVKGQYKGRNILTLTSQDRVPGAFISSNKLQAGFAVRNPNTGGTYLFTMKIRLSRQPESMRLFLFYVDPQGKYHYDTKHLRGTMIPPAGQWHTVFLDTQFPQKQDICVFLLEIYDPKALTCSFCDPRLSREEEED